MNKFFESALIALDAIWSAKLRSLMTVLGIVLYGTIALLPLFLQTLLGYPALQSGLAVSPRGIAIDVLVASAGALGNDKDPRHRHQRDRQTDPPFPFLPDAIDECRVAFGLRRCTGGTRRVGIGRAVCIRGCRGRCRSNPGHHVEFACSDARHLLRVCLGVFPARRGPLSIHAAGDGRGIRHAHVLLPFAHTDPDHDRVVDTHGT